MEHCNFRIVFISSFLSPVLANFFDETCTTNRLVPRKQAATHNLLSIGFKKCLLYLLASLQILQQETGEITGDGLFAETIV